MMQTCWYKNHLGPSVLWEMGWGLDLLLQGIRWGLVLLYVFDYTRHEIGEYIQSGVEWGSAPPHIHLNFVTWYMVKQEEQQDSL